MGKRRQYELEPYDDNDFDRPNQAYQKAQKRKQRKYEAELTEFTLDEQDDGFFERLHEDTSRAEGQGPADETKVSDDDA